MEELRLCDRISQQTLSSELTELHNGWPLWPTRGKLCWDRKVLGVVRLNRAVGE